MIKSISACKRSRFPVPEEAERLQNVTEPPACFTVGKVTFPSSSRHSAEAQAKFQFQFQFVSLQNPQNVCGLLIRFYMFFYTGADFSFAFGSAVLFVLE